MSTTTEAPLATVATSPPALRPIRVVNDDSPVANLLDTARYEHLQRISKMMSLSSLLPKHLAIVKIDGREYDLDPDVKAANCFRIVNQALRWGFDPFAIIDETYVVGGKLGYQGKLVAAVINARAGLKSRLRYEFAGSGNDRTVTVIGTFDGDSEPSTADLKWIDAKTDNQMWKKDPDQKLIYSGVMKWARRHCPEIVLGVLTDDDLERMSSNTDGGSGASLTEKIKATELPPAATSPAIGHTPPPVDSRPKDVAPPREPVPVEQPAAGPAATETSPTDADGVRDIPDAYEGNEEPEPDPVNEQSSAEPADITERSNAQEIVNWLVFYRPDKTMSVADATVFVERRMRTFLNLRWERQNEQQRKLTVHRIKAGEFGWD